MGEMNGGEKGKREKRMYVCVYECVRERERVREGGTRKGNREEEKSFAVSIGHINIYLQLSYARTHARTNQKE